MNETESLQTPLTDEIDIGRYIAVFARWWRLIALCAVLGVLAALSVSLMTSRTYRAESSLAIVRSATIVNFEPKIRTVSDTDPTSQFVDQVSRRKSLVSLAESAELAEAVVSQIGNQLPERLHDPTALARTIKVSNDGDLIVVQVTTGDPAQAALIANAWAQLYQDRVNDLYSENPLNPEVLSAQVSDAKQKYDIAQAALGSFMNTSPLEQLARQQNLLASQLDNQVNVLAKLIQLEAEAKALRQRIASGSADTSHGDELASLLLEASAFSTGAGLPVNLQIAFDQLNSTTSAADRLTQLDSLIAAMQARQQNLQTDQHQALLQQLNQVKSQIEQAQAKQRELTSTRDLTWSTYQSLVTQKAAASIMSGAPGQVIRVATPAIVPTEPNGTNRSLNALLGGMVGLLIGTVLAFVLEFKASGLHSPERVQETLQLPTLAVLPELPLELESNLSTTATSEELRRLRYTLFSLEARRVLAITSADSDGDVNSLAAQLALVVAQSGKKVLLVDANLREPVLHTLFRSERGQGLAEALRTGAANDARQYTKVSRIEGLSFMPAGAPVADPAAQLDTAVFRTLVSKLRENFEIVIINTPPVLDAVDSIIVARAAEGVLLVVDRVETSAEAAQNAKHRLAENQVPILGVVLSHPAPREREGAGNAQRAPARFWSTMRTRTLQFLGPRPG